MRHDSRTLGYQAQKVLPLVDNQIQRRAVIKTLASNPFEVQLFEGEQLARGIDPLVDFPDDLHTHLRLPGCTVYSPFILTAW